MVKQSKKKGRSRFPRNYGNADQLAWRNIPADCNADQLVWRNIPADCNLRASGLCSNICWGSKVDLTVSGLRRAVKKIPEFNWLKKCDNWFNMMEEWSSWNCNKKLASLADPFMRFCPTIWRWDLLVRSLFRAVSASRWRTEPHISLVVQRFLAEKSIPVITQPPYSLDLAPSDVRLFPILKMFLKGTRFRVSYHGGHRIECDGWTLEDSKRSLRPVNPTMAGLMEQVCVCARVWLWRWLGKRCYMSYHYSAIPQFRELCDCPS